MMQAAPPAVVRELEAIEYGLAETYKKHDCAGWGALLGDEWQVTHITGQIITKQEALGLCREAPEVNAAYDSLTYRVYGDMAIVTGRNTAWVTGNPQKIILRFTDIFMRRHGKWVVVMSHATRVPE
jgi:hypothetical protein